MAAAAAAPSGIAKIHKSRIRNEGRKCRLISSSSADDFRPPSPSSQARIHESLGDPSFFSLSLSFFLLHVGRRKQSAASTRDPLLRDSAINKRRRDL